MFYKKYKNSNSSNGQDSFVLSILKGKKEGFYVELGSGDPINDNNTYLLENEFSWRGLGVELESNLVEKYLKLRKNSCVLADALTFDYEHYFKENNYPEIIDYLQIDIDGHEKGNCLLALIALPMLKYRFRVITIEHDLSRNFKWQAMRDAQREILHSLGYSLVGQLPGEDWWVDRSLVDKQEDGNEIPSILQHYNYEEEI